MLRIFRVFKLARFFDAGRALTQGIWASRHKITVFLGTVLTLVLIVGALMRLIAGAESGFDSIPRGMFWAIVTLTAVGCGKTAPTTALGQAPASVVMVLGYGIIAVPTGIVTVALAGDCRVTTRSYPQCSAEGHDSDATFCEYYGAKL